MQLRGGRLSLLDYHLNLMAGTFHLCFPQLCDTLGGDTV